MALVTKSIGTASRDYSTITLWEADLDNTTPYDAGDTALGECYNDSAFDEDVTFNGGATIGLATVQLSVASGQRHNGTAGTGARVVQTGLDNMLTFSVASTLPDYIFEWLEVNQNGQGHPGAGGAVKLIDTGAVTKKLCRRILVHDVVENTRNGIGMYIRAAKVYDSIIYDITTGQTDDAAFGTFVEANRAGEFYNLTVLNVRTIASSTANATGMSFQDATNNIVKNCIAMDTVEPGSGTAADFSPASPVNAVTNNNMSSDTTASGAGSLISKASSNQFVSTTNGSEDLHLKSGADAIDAGADLGTSPSEVNIDIDNRDRDALGDVWDMGADEFVSSEAVVSPMPNLLLMGVG